VGAHSWWHKCTSHQPEADGWCNILDSVTKN
jgi:hypothetical protein